MKVLVLGAGVVGVSAAYYLARAGHRVSVVDRRPAAGMETSFANAGILCRYTARPWAGPSTPGMILREFGRTEAPYLVRPRADPAMWRWLASFLRHCTGARYRRTSATLTRLALHSADLMARLRETESLAYDHAARGVLHLYRSQRGLDEAAAGASGDAAARPEVLDRAGCQAVEPALAQSAVAIAGGLYWRDEESGDAHLFTARLARRLAENGVAFHYGVTLRRLLREGEAVVGADSDRGPLRAEATVLSLASQSPSVLRPLGIRLPVYPVKGYSVTIPAASDDRAPRVGIVESSRKIAMSRLGDRLRIAGTAELAGHDPRPDEARARAILRHAMSLFPEAGDGRQARFWAGLRPMTPDGAPVLGATPYRGLYLDTGHGSLGWSLACGSGRVVADLVSGRAPAIDLAGLTLERFA